METRGNWSSAEMIFSGLDKGEEQKSSKRPFVSPSCRFNIEISNYLFVEESCKQWLYAKEFSQSCSAQLLASRELVLRGLRIVSESTSTSFEDVLLFIGSMSISNSTKSYRSRRYFGEWRSQLGNLLPCRIMLAWQDVSSAPSSPCPQYLSGRTGTVRRAFSWLLLKVTITV